MSRVSLVTSLPLLKTTFGVHKVSFLLLLALALAVSSLTDSLASNLNALQTDQVMVGSLGNRMKLLVDFPADRMTGSWLGLSSKLLLLREVVSELGHFWRLSGQIRFWSQARFPCHVSRDHVSCSMALLSHAASLYRSASEGCKHQTSGSLRFCRCLLHEAVTLSLSSSTYRSYHSRGSSWSVRRFNLSASSLILTFQWGSRIGWLRLEATSKRILERALRNSLDHFRSKSERSESQEPFDCPWWYARTLQGLSTCLQVGRGQTLQKACSHREPSITVLLAFLLFCGKEPQKAVAWTVPLCF